jgi:hypothetical protein
LARIAFEAVPVKDYKPAHDPSVKQIGFSPQLAAGQLILI